MKTMKVVCVLAALWIPCSVFAAEAPLSDRLPASALVYVGWAGSQNEDFQGSMFGQLLQEPAGKKIWDAIQRAAADATGGQSDLAFAMGELLARHPMAFALTDVQVNETNNGNNTQVNVDGKAVLVIDLGKDQEQFVEMLDQVFSLTGLAEHCSEVKIGGKTFTTIQPDESITFAWGYDGNLFIVGINGGEKDVVGIKPAAALASARPFAAAMNSVAPTAAQVAYFVDVKRLMPIVIALEKRDVDRTNEWRQRMNDDGRGPHPLAEPHVPVVLAALGLDKVTALAGATSVADKGLLSRCKIFTPAPHKGLPAMFNGKPLTPADLAALPADCDFACMVRVDPANILARVREIAAALEPLNPGAGKEMDEFLRAIRNELGVDIEKDLFAALGDTWSLTMAPSQGGMFTGICATVNVKDAKKLQEITRNIEDRLMPQHSDLRFERATFGPMEVSYIPKDHWPVAPAWGVHKDRLYVALWPQVVASAARTSGEQPGKLTDNKGFAAGMSQMSPKPMCVSFTNTPQLIRPFYGLAMIGWTMAAGEVRRNVGIDLSPADLPTMGQIEKFLWPAMSSISLDNDGLMFESYSSLPSLGLTSILPMLGAVSH